MAEEDIKKAGSALTEGEDFKAFLEDLLGLFPETVREFITTHSREIISGILVIILVIVLYSGYSSYSENQEEKGAMLAGTALFEQDHDKKIDMLTSIIREHGMTDAYKLALPMLARTYYEKGDRNKALKFFKEAQSEFSSDSIGYKASLMGEGYLLEEKGAFDEALKRFDALIEAKERLGFEKIARLEKALAAKRAGKKDIALQEFNLFLNESPSSNELEFVKFEILKLKAKEEAKGAVKKGKTEDKAKVSQ